MRFAKTLRARFALWVALLLFIALLVLGGLVYGLLSYTLYNSIDTELRLSALQAADSADLDSKGGELEMFDGVRDPEALDSFVERGLTIRLLSEDGRLFDSIGPLDELTISPAELRAARANETTLTTVELNGQAVRVFTLPMVDGKRRGIIQTAQPLSEVERTLDQLMAIFGITVPIIVVIAALGGYVLAARALAPISQITKTAQRISAEDLHARLNLPPSDDEVGELAKTFDSMIARLEQAFQRERQFTSDASHELRTPLSAMQLILSVTRSEERTPEQYRQALDDLSGETARLHSLVEDLLALARGHVSWQSNREQIDLALLLSDVSDSLRPLAEAKGLVLEQDLPDQLEIEADSDALMRLFLNLIDNAIKYTDRGSVRVVLRAKAQCAHIMICDTGRGIAPEQQPHVFERFYQGDPSRRSRGAGLGLAIAREIVEAHQGRIYLESQLGRGTCFHIELPYALK